MTTNTPSERALAPAPLDIAAPAVQAVDGRSYLDWGAIIGGAILAAALSFVLYSFGTALGLGISSPRPDAGISAVWISIFAGVWMLLTQVASFGVGGYLAGRLRRRVDDAKAHEVDLRDGSHGLLVWAFGALVGAFFLASGLFGAAQTTADTVGSSLSAVAEAAPDVDAGYLADTPMRSGAEGSPPSEETREAVGRIVQRALSTGELSEADMDYVTTALGNAARLDAEEA